MQSAKDHQLLTIYHTLRSLIEECVSLIILRLFTALFALIRACLLNPFAKQFCKRLSKIWLFYWKNNKYWAVYCFFWFLLSVRSIGSIESSWYFLSIGSSGSKGSNRLIFSILSILSILLILSILSIRHLENFHSILSSHFWNNYDLKMIQMVLPGIEPGTFIVWSRHYDHYTTGPLLINLW